MTKKFFAAVTLKENRNATLLVIRSNYTSKQKFAADLRLNGYRVKSVFSEEDVKRARQLRKEKGYGFLNNKQETMLDLIEG